MLLFIVATIAGIAVLALLGGAVGSFEGKKASAGWGYLGGVFVIVLAFSHFGVIMGYWDLPSWVPLGNLTLGQPQAPSWLQRTGSTGSAALTPESLKDELETKLKDLQKKHGVLVKYLVDLKQEKEQTASDLKMLTSQLKLESIAALKDNPVGQEKVHRLGELVQKIQGAEKTKTNYELALTRGNNALRDLKRQMELKEAGISEEELQNVTVTIRLVDEKLQEEGGRTPVSALEMEAILKTEVGLKN